MSRKNKDYWEERQEQRYLSGERSVREYYEQLEDRFRQAQQEIDAVINQFYARYARENEISDFTQAQKILNETELTGLREFIELAEKRMGEYDQELNNLSMKARISRYQAMKMQIDVILQELYACHYEVEGEKALREVYSDTYYHYWYDSDIFRGFHEEFSQINVRMIDQLIAYPFNGASFSERLWKQKDYLLQKLNESLTTTLVQGKNPDTLAKEFAKAFDAREYEAKRLLHTEASFLIEQATQKGYEEDGVEWYSILATLDSKTCEICGRKDGKRYRVGEGIVGKTLNPFHPGCRCTTIPEDEEPDEDDTRMARDPVTGRNYEVPANMTYTEWHKEFIESNPAAVLAEKKLRNIKTDKEQYKRYKERLGRKYVPASLDDFQNVKYAVGGDEYGILKAQYKGMGYYNKALENEPAITEHVKSVAAEVGVSMSGLEYRIKGKDSYLRKIRSKYEAGKVDYEVKDIIRYTYTAEAEKYTEKTLGSIAKHAAAGYNTTEVKNYWVDMFDPYNGVNTTLSSPVGQKFELQYHTPESFELKNGKMHELYEKQRLISDVHSKEFMDLEDEMFELSDCLVIPVGVERIKDVR